jgi:single-strand DNA-binding protein
MANGLNKVFFGGHLGDDPELRATQSGQSILKFRIAASESYLDRNRVRQEKTEWQSVVVWGKRAEALSKFLRKGSQIFVEGKLSTSSWDGDDGRKRYRTEIVADRVFFGGSNNPRNKNQMRDPENRRPNIRDNDDDYRPDASAPSQGGGGYDNEDYGSGGGDDDIPF